MVVQMGSGERIHYLDWGAPTVPGPTILLLHGIASTAWSWAPVARRIHGRVRVLAPDLRGHGLSEGARSGLDLESMAWDALTVLASNGVGAGGRRAARGHRGARPGRHDRRDRGPTPAGLGLGPGARGWRLGGPGRLDAHEPGRVPGGHRRATRGARVDGCVPGRPARLRSGFLGCGPGTRGARPGGPEARRATWAWSRARRPCAASWRRCSGTGRSRRSRRHRRGCWCWWPGRAPRTTRWPANGSSPWRMSSTRGPLRACRRHASCGCRGPATT